VSVLDRIPGLGAIRLARMAGSSIAAPDAAPWLSDFLNAAHFARPADERDQEDLRLAFAILTTRWWRLGGRRLRAWDVLAFHQAFGPDRVLRSPWLRLDRYQLLAGAARLHGPWFPAAYADRERRGWGIAFRDAAERAGYEPEARLRHAALGELTPPEAPPSEQEWSVYRPVLLPSEEATIAALADPPRWPDAGTELGRFIPLRDRGLDGQTFGIEVMAQPAPRTPVFTRAYVTATRVLRPGRRLDAALRELGRNLERGGARAGAARGGGAAPAARADHARGALPRGRALALDRLPRWRPGVPAGRRVVGPAAAAPGGRLPAGRPRGAAPVLGRRRPRPVDAALVRAAGAGG